MKSVTSRLSPRQFATWVLLARWWLGAVILVVALTLTMSVPVRAQEQELQDLATQLAQKITKSGKKTVAVVDFTDLQGNVTELGRYLAEEMSVSLSQRANGFTVIDRTYLKAILREHKLAASGLIDPVTASKLGQITGVQGLVAGTIVPLGDNVSLSVKVLDANTEAIIAATIIQVPRTEAINRLLKTGVSERSSGSASADGAEQSPSANDNAATHREADSPVSVRERYFLFVVRKCQRKFTDVVCSGAITDEASRETQLTLSGGYLLDNLGHQYEPAWNAMTLGASGRQQNMEPGLPMDFTVSARNVDASASSMNIVLNYAYPGGGIFGTSSTVTLRKIPIEGK